MKRIAIRYKCAGIILLVLSGVLIYRGISLINLYTPDYSEITVSMELHNNEIYLNVYHPKEITCNHLIENLGITQFTMKNKIYTPVCFSVDNNNKKIIYTEKVKDI